MKSIDRRSFIVGGIAAAVASALPAPALGKEEVYLWRLAPGMDVIEETSGMHNNISRCERMVFESSIPSPLGFIFTSKEGKECFMECEPLGGGTIRWNIYEKTKETIYWGEDYAGSSGSQGSS